MNKNRIEIGDTVRVFFNRSDMLVGVVDYVPSADSAHDCWVILDKRTNNPAYVQIFDYIILETKHKSVKK